MIVSQLHINLLPLPILHLSSLVLRAIGILCIVLNIIIDIEILCGIALFQQALPTRLLRQLLILSGITIGRVVLMRGFMSHVIPAIGRGTLG